MTKLKRLSCFILSTFLTISNVCTNITFADIPAGSSSGIKGGESASSGTRSISFDVYYDNKLAETFPEGLTTPKVDYPKSSATDDATLSVAQMISFNDMVQSYMHYTKDEAKALPWASAVNRTYAIVDWRYWGSSKTAGISNTLSVQDAKEDGSYAQITTSKFAADEDMVRAINILGNNAFIPENVDMSKGAWIHAIDNKTIMSRTEAICALYKAMGNSHYLPIMIAYDNLDGGTDAVKRTELKDTSLVSLEGADKWLYYAVQTERARNIVYMSNNLIEGYLWDALQDGIISTKALTEDAKYSVCTKYRQGVYSTPLSPYTDTYGEVLPSTGLHTNIKELDEKHKNLMPGIMLGYNMLPRKENDYMVLRYEAPQAFYDENISFLDFCVYAAQIMNMRGEPVLTNAEMEMLTASYGAAIPTQTSDEYYNALMYLISRGIIDSSYFGDKLYDALTWKDAYVICSRIIDKDSRLTYKNVSIPFDASMAEKGYTKVTPAVTDIEVVNTKKVGKLTYNKTSKKFTVSDTLKSAIKADKPPSKDGDIYKTLYVMKQEHNTFINSKGEEVFPHISRDQDKDVGEYGYLEHTLYYDWQNNPYYKIVIYKDQVIPDCYDYNDANGNFKQNVHSAELDYYLYAPDCNGRARVANIQYPSSNEERSDVYKHTGRNGCSDLWTQSVPQDTRQFKAKASSITYTPTDGPNNSGNANSTPSKDPAGQQVVVAFDLPASAMNNILTIDGVAPDQFKNPDDKDTQITYDNNEIYRKVIKTSGADMWRIYLKINDTDEIEAAVASKIVWKNASSNNSVAYVRRSDTKDVYYGSNFLANTAGIQVVKNIKDKYFTITTPYESMRLYYDDNSGWTLYSSNTIMTFSKDLDAIKENTNKSTTDAYFVHSLLVEKYLRSTYKKGWSSYVTSGGVLNLGSLASNSYVSNNWLMTAIDGVKSRNLLAPQYSDYSTNSSGVSSNSAPVFKPASGDFYYMDLAQVPDLLTNYVIVWQVKSMTDISANVIELVPTEVATSYTAGGAGSSVLKDLIRRVPAIKDLNSNLDKNFTCVNLKATLYSDIKGSNPHTSANYSRDDKYTKLSRLVYDPTTFSLLYRITTTASATKQDKPIVDQVSLLSSGDGTVKTFGLPYIYNNVGGDKSLVFLNLPYEKKENSSNELVYYKSSLGSNYTQGQLSTLGNRVYSDAKEGNASNVSWYPVMPLVTVQAKSTDTPINYVNHMTTTKVFAQLGEKVSYVAIVGPWHVPIQKSGPSTKVIESSVDIPNKMIYERVLGNIAKDQSLRTLYTPSEDNKVYVIRKQHCNVIYTADLCLTDTAATDGLLDSASRLSASIVGTVVDFLDKVYQAEKLLDSKFYDVNNFLALCYWVVIVLIPRFLFGLLFVYQILSLIVHVRIVQVFCDKVFDFYKFLTFGRIPFSAVDPKKLWTTGMVGSVIIILISRDYGWKFLNWVISNALEFISRM